VQVQDSRERLLSKLAPESRKALENWLKTNRREIQDAGWEASGYTSAQLLGAYVSQKGKPVRGVVIKVWPGGDEVPHEPECHRQALDDAKKYASCHLAGIRYRPIVLENNGCIIFQRVAGGGFDKLSTLGALIRENKHAVDRLAPRCGSLTQSVLFDWAKATKMRDVPACQFLREILGQRVEEGGTLTAWAARHGGLMEQPSFWLEAGGERLVNPFALAMDPAASEGVTIHNIVGRAHGDLHPDNILVPKSVSADPEAFWLVDLSRYRNDAPIAFDPAYIATTIAATLLPGMNAYDRSALIDLLLNPAADSDVEALGGLRKVLLAINDAGTRYAAKSDLETLWRPQALLCLLASGLVLSGRRILDPTDRTWFFWLAAHAATSFARSQGLDNAGDPLRLPKELIPSSGADDLGPRPSRVVSDTTDREDRVTKDGEDWETEGPEDRETGEAVVLPFPADPGAGDVPERPFASSPQAPATEVRPSGMGGPSPRAA
jgi:hypothetical protein